MSPGPPPPSAAEQAQEIRAALERARSGSHAPGAIGLVIQGGGMRGVYSMGALAALEEMGFGASFGHVAGSSAGALNGAHFLTGQAAFGVDTYVRFLSTRRFADPFRFKKRVDIDYLIDDVLKRQRPLDLARLRSCTSTLHISLTDYETARTHYVTNRHAEVDLWEAFRATAALPVLYNKPVPVGLRSYMDGGMRDLVPLTRIIKAGCRFIVVVLTQPLTHRSRRIGSFLRLLTWLSTRHYSAALKEALFSTDHRYNRTMALLHAHPTRHLPDPVRLVVVAPRHRNRLVSRMTIDPRHLKTCAEQGRLDAHAAFGLSPRRSA